MSIETKEKIKAALQGFEGSNLTRAALALFETLGYDTSRQASIERNTACPSKKRASREEHWRGNKMQARSAASMRFYYLLGILFTVTSVSRAVPRDMGENISSVAIDIYKSMVVDTENLVLSHSAFRAVSPFFMPEQRVAQRRS